MPSNGNGRIEVVWEISVWWPNRNGTGSIFQAILSIQAFKLRVRSAQPYVLALQSKQKQRRSGRRRRYRADDGSSRNRHESAGKTAMRALNAVRPLIHDGCAPSSR